MRYVIDTCSLLNIVRFYLPFDTENYLYNTLKKGVEAKEYIIIDKVYKQCSYTAKGEVLKGLPYLKENQTKTADYLPDKRFFHLLDNDFKNRELCKLKNITDEEFEVEKMSFIEDADVKMLLYCNGHKNSLVAPVIITDESAHNNDNKFFKKIPTLCETLGIEVMSSPDFLKKIIKVDFSV